MVESAQMSSSKPQTLDIKQGKEIMISNGSKKNTAAYLKTKKEYSDHTIETEFMIPLKSNSGFYVQGCYEIQILDSFGKDKVNSSDIGSLYQRWDKQRPQDQRGYDGVAAQVNAAKPAGTWQTLKIQFRAPRFHAQGIKVENAKFIQVILNDQITLENTEAKGPTRGHPIKQENATGPLCIQGDHGPIVIRKLKITEEDFSDK